MFTVFSSQFTLSLPFTVYNEAKNGKLKTENALKTVNRKLKTATQGVAYV